MSCQKKLKRRRNIDVLVETFNFNLNSFLKNIPILIAEKYDIVVIQCNAKASNYIVSLGIISGIL